MMNVKDTIPLFKVYMNKNVSGELTKIINSGYIGQGKKVDEFEKKLQKKFHNKNLLTVNSATSGLTLALHMLKKPWKTWSGINDNDEVLSTPLTCTATNWPILANNINIKWVDVDKKTCNIDLDDLERKITKKTKIILVVHWGGYPIDLFRLKEIQEKTYKLYGFKPAIIEDAAHSFLSKIHGQLIGNNGNITIFSLQAIKHLTAGDGGIMIFPHKELYERAKLLRWYGIDREDRTKTDFRCEEDVGEFGFKYHMNDINATIGIGNLESIDDIVNKHIGNANYYNNNLKNLKNINLLQIEDSPINRESSYWLYTIYVKNRRDELQKFLSDNGIQSSRVHERNDKHTCVKEYKTFLPSLDNLVSHTLCIPVGWWLTKENLNYIVEKIKEWDNNNV